MAAVCCEIPGCVAFALGNRTCMFNNLGPACALQPGGEAASCKASDCSFMQLYSSVKAHTPGPVGPGWRTYVNTRAAATLPPPPAMPSVTKSGPCTANETFCIELDIPTATVSITTAEYKVKVFVELNAPLRAGKPDRSAGILRVQAEQRRSGAPFSRTVTLEPFREEGWKTPLGAAFCDPRFEHADTLASKTGDEHLTWFHRNKLKDSTYQTDTMVGQGMGPPTDALPEIFAHRAFGARLAGAGLTAKNSTTLSGSGLSKVDLVASLLTLTPTEAPTESAWLEVVATVPPAPATAAAGTCHTPAGRASGRACTTSWEDLMERSYIEVTAAGDANASEHLAAKRITDHVSWDRYLSLIQGRAGFGPIKFNGQMFTGASGNFGTPKVNRTWDRRGWGAGYWWQNERPPYYNALAQGDLDTMRSFLDFYLRMLPYVNARSKAQFKGLPDAPQLSGIAALYEETCTQFGSYLPANWANAGASLKDPCIYTSNHTRAHGASTNPYIRFHWTGSLELSLMIMDL